MDSTTVQSQFIMEGGELVLDLFRTRTVLTCTEIQQDVDLETHKQKLVGVEGRKGDIQKKVQ